MLSDQSLEIAHRIVTQLKQRGIKLSPREGTPVALLVGGMPAMPANLMPGQYVDVIARDAMGLGAVHGAESLHDEKMPGGYKVLSAHRIPVQTEQSQIPEA